ncbi:macro domain-containing protein [Shewanella septentrionalis]|uniref:Macro domain-containing protein n=1 Tax=Shewanella septentrionalis TaxID=2952223 RepID=A0A9X2WY73_9GAMM|nr:macro domain-containing protein [Shewanella septentrionalis]MCT7947339.1 macro domain-containing protein [Shewanella septentrionalis]
MKKVHGNIFELVENNKADVLVHGCNCLCNMGAGIALMIKSKYPEAYNVDLQTERGASTKLGTYTKVIINRRGKSFAIVNAYTQYDWKGNGVLADYDAIRQVFRAIKKEFSGLRIVYPLIGAGLAKGNWQIIESIIDEELKGEMHYCVKLIVSS